MNHVFVITGGSGGMGKATAELVGKKGTILLADMNEARLEQTKQELAKKGITDVHYQTVDITDRENVKALADKAASLGKLKSIIHTAGLSPTMGDARRILEVNLVGTGIVLEAFYPLAEEGTVAVCIASMSAYNAPRQGPYTEWLKQPLAENVIGQLLPMIQNQSAGAAYALSKLGVLLIVEEQAIAWGQKGARIVSVSPGSINTPMGKQEAEAQPMMQAMLQVTPLQRFGEAHEIATAVEFLISDGASYITGTDLRVDGGTTPNVAKLVEARSQQ
ncbi:NAD(P)-dependent dehydrogenase (short-subunit alcohol dehydrogenase family) [Cytobacillus eiseniae]|uniref:NAD(P)-dependent dehydrogenase (Short-subunit alcohol dehydrogenase family) n=1 Tax=Cytobacillus eiseniae TaxID=762947 RepID=A0ABS4RBS9_9BACI|nr:SDR family oxidoreductase [Cytobacillus eiseniae]MBP2240355.1 NAD(P)-dependent dehydrogenase (short-subunit alcohol dehydrogenase family) [Cytobacillus eiseniae]